MNRRDTECFQPNQMVLHGGSGRVRNQSRKSENAMNQKLLTTTQFAAAMTPPVSRGRVIHLIAAGRIVGQRVGRDMLIDPKELRKVADRKPGRPVKAK